ncbi:uncharacterized protein [Eurosta solidaginis]|uniref:uncharacterized protein n=1 Tax=Eurosta solidaginis TaxID=178769 RepID=UPI003531410E
MHSGCYQNINLLDFSEWLSFRANAAEQRLQDSRKCPVCNENHFIINCSTFKAMSYNEKWVLVNRKKLCRSCLKSHDRKFCKDQRECDKNNCTEKHHVLLHTPELESNNPKQDMVGIHVQQTSNVLYRILPITIHSQHATVDIYALLDDGSGPTIIEHDILKRLQMKGEQNELRLRWTDGSVRVEENSTRVSSQVSGHTKNKRYTLRDVCTVTKLDLPPQTLIMPELANKYKHLKGLPVESYKNVVSLVIIGINNKHVAMSMKFRAGKSDEPAATKTRLGWTIYGVLKQSNVKARDDLQLHICECGDDIALQKLLIENMRHESSDAQLVTCKVKYNLDKDQLAKYIQRRPLYGKATMAIK